MPFRLAAAAAAQLLLGRTLFAEAVLDACAYGVAAAFTLIAAHRLSRSLAVALLVTLLTVAIFPRPYAYPKLLLTAVAPLAISSIGSHAINHRLPRFSAGGTRNSRQYRVSP